MSRYHSYLSTAANLLDKYSGEEPFAGYIRKFFATEKKYGSTDRKQIAHLCYCFFRLGKSLKNISIPDRTLIGLFLCSSEPNKILETLKPEWNENVSLSLEEKSKMVGAPFFINEIFPWSIELGPSVEYSLFAASFLAQPNLYIRIRPDNDKGVKRKLAEASINYDEPIPSCLSFPNSTRIDDVLLINKEVVIQDLNSQRVGEYMLLANNPVNILEAWDCCAASGGKSILAYDILPLEKITVSDIRATIIANLKKRFSTAGIRDYEAFIIDLYARDVKIPFEHSFPLVIADVPCSGSGTWGRTPEQLYFFNEKKIDHYTNLQTRITDNAVAFIPPGGYFLYITCSVFKKENEDQVDRITATHGLNLVKMELLKGYDIKADTLFVALLQKPTNG